MSFFLDPEKNISLPLKIKPPTFTKKQTRSVYGMVSRHLIGRLKKVLEKRSNQKNGKNDWQFSLVSQLTNESRTKDLIVANQHTEKTSFFSSECFKVFSVKISQKRPKTMTHQYLE